METIRKNYSNYLDKIFDLAPNASAIIATDGNFLTFNKEFEKLFEYAQNHIENIKLDDLLVLPETSKAKNIKLKEILTSFNNISNFECQIKSKSGKLVDGKCQISSVFDENNNHIFNIVQVYDLTSTKKIEEELKIYQNNLEQLVTERTTEMIRINRDLEEEVKERKSAQYNSELLRKQIETILRVTKTEIIIIDSNFDVTYSDPATIEKYGSFTGKKCFDFHKCHNDTCPNCNAVKVFQNKTSISQEEVLPNEDNRIVKTTIFPFQDHNGAWFAAIIRIDITEQKRNQEQIKESEERFRTLTERTGDIIFIINSLEKISYVSPSIYSIGYGSDELINKRIDKLIHPDDRHIIRQYYKRSINKVGEPVKIPNIRFITKNGEQLHFEGIFRCLINQPGINGVVFNGRDITEKIQAEEILREAKVKAEEATRFKSEFLAYLTHEIRTPLSTILGMSEIMSEKMTPEEQKKYLKVQKESGKTVLTLLNDVLDVAKVEAGALTLEEIPFDIRDLILSTVEKMQIAAEKNNTQLSYEIDDSIPDYLVGDPTRLTQIFNNLLSNAIKFTSRGKVKLVATLLKKDNENGTIKFEFIDEGIGIPKDKMANIFQKFGQQDSSTTRKFGGTGLGLTLVSNFLKAMNSNIELKSKEGEGSNFFFTLQLPIGKKTSLDDGIMITKEQLLIIDDEQEAIDTTVELLEDLEINILTANNGQEALNILQNRSIDTILTDLEMPHMNGIEFIARTRKNHPALPIVMLTGKAGDKEKLATLKLGALKIFDKPIMDIELFRNTIKKYLAQGYQLRITKTEIRKPEYFEPINILFADDTQDSQILIKALLKDYPFNLTFAINGQEAYEIIKEKDIDLIFLDVEMPILNGYEAADKIRAHEKKTGKSQPVPIIALSAHSGSEYIQKTLESGFDSYLMKPFSKQELIQKISDLNPLDSDSSESISA